MDAPETTVKQDHPYGRFAVAVAVYVVGVSIFSGLIYLEHHSLACSVATPSYSIFSHVALIEGTERVFLFIMAFILVFLHTRAKNSSAKHEREINIKLQREFEKLKEHEAELQDAIRDLKRFNVVATNREERIVELKAEVNRLLKEQKRPDRYAITL
ncbi:MAG: hypothetical protein JXR25_02915 [Pontiellaceae bacterium]|nr:hypothetical protein [Pontiellaceae bacterium]MBN2783754.1 hypothetical protein [Pontiellaceae bacterium]